MAEGDASRRIFVVDDDDAFRNSLVDLLESFGWTVSAFACAEDFLESLSRLDPGLVLLDLNLSDRSGLELVELGLLDPDRFGVVMITGAGDVQTAVRSLKAGALDFVEKPFVASALIDKLDQIHQDFQTIVRARGAAIQSRLLVDRLSNREREVLERLLSGASNKHIARDLDLSPRTVEMHRARMLQKLGARSTTHALEIARLAGIRSPASGETHDGPGTGP